MLRAITDFFFQNQNNPQAQNQQALTFKQRLAAMNLQDLPIPHELQCPVSFELMNDPSLIAGDHDAVDCVDRSSLEQCHGVHPLTRTKFNTNQIIRNTDMFNKIEAFVTQLERIHRKEGYIQGWKNEIAALNYDTYKQLPALHNVQEDQLQLMFIEAQIELQNNLDAVVLRQYVDLVDYIQLMKTSFTDNHDRDLQLNIEIYERKLIDLCDSFPNLLQEKKPEAPLQDDQDLQDEEDANEQIMADAEAERIDIQVVIQLGIFNVQQHNPQAAQQQAAQQHIFSMNNRSTD